MTDFQCLINRSIKNLRLHKGMTQEKFSELCGISSDNYRNIEYNRHTPKASTIDKICNACNITPLELLQLGTENKHDQHKEKVITSINTLTYKELEILMDCIHIIKKYDKQ